ncbi:MAG: hypothetical protein FWF90_08155 [Promicromonosporaceae bacterium]|nr:hypothetical protein [Promicromonosporaceae bacterium]
MSTSTVTNAVGVAPAPTERWDALTLTAAVASLAAGLAHYAAIGLHLPDEVVAAVLFTIVGGAQIIWPTLLGSGRRWVLLAGIVINGASVVAWTLSRTVGLALGHESEVEPVGLLDAGCTLAELVVVVAAVVLLRRRLARTPAPGGPEDAPDAD